VSIITSAHIQQTRQETTQLSKSIMQGR